MSQLQRLREQFRETFEEAQERGRQFWMTLAPREKIILSSLAGILGALLLLLILKESATFFFDFSTQAERNMVNAEKIQRLSRDISSLRPELSRYERLQDKKADDQDLMGFLNAEASNSGVKFEKIAPTRPRTKDGKNESGAEWIEVQFQKGTQLEPLLSFLKEAESAVGVQLVELTIEPDFADPKKLAGSAVFTGEKL